MKKLIAILFLIICVPTFGQFNDSEKMFGQQLDLGHWSTDGLVGYWRFIEAGNLVDDSFNKLHGTLIHDPPWVGEGISFDGVNDYVSVPSNPRLENFTAFTLGAWINPQGQPGAAWGRILSKDQGGTSDDYALSHTIAAGDPDNNIACRIRTDVGTTTLVGATTVSPNTGWHFVVGTWDGATVKLYLNGEREDLSPTSSPAANAGTLDDSNLPLGIGGHQASNTRRFNGLMRTAFIYNRALSDSEIQQLYINPDLPIIDDPIWLLFSPAAPGGIDIGALMRSIREEKTGGKQAKRGGKQ